jgi:allantoin racemase
MTRRIAVIGTGFTPTGGREPPREIAALARPGLRPELIESRLSVFPGTPYERGLAVLGYVEAGIRARDEGFDAVFINTFGDYGIVELKSALDIPVVGAGEAAMALAATLGRSFAILTIWPSSLNFIYDERLQACSMAARCASIVNVLAPAEMTACGGADDPVTAMRSAKAEMISRIVSAAQDALADGRVDAIVLGCTCMAPIGGMIAARLPVPVIEPMTAGYAATETMLALGLRQSKRAYPASAAAALDLARRLGAGEGASTTEACAPCAVATAAE